MRAENECWALPSPPDYGYGWALRVMAIGSSQPRVTDIRACCGFVAPIAAAMALAIFSPPCPEGSMGLA